MATRIREVRPASMRGRVAAAFAAALLALSCAGYSGTPAWAAELSAQGEAAGVESSAQDAAADEAGGQQVAAGASFAQDGAVVDAPAEEAPADSAAQEDALAEDEPAPVIGEAAALEPAQADSRTLPAGTQATGDPSQVDGYDAAADAAPEEAEAPAGYDASATFGSSDIATYSSETRSGDWSYYLYSESDGTSYYVLTGYYGTQSSITLPSTLDGKQITMVNFYSGNLPKTVTAVNFPASIKYIGPSCFSYSKVSKVTFPANSQLESVGQNAFYNTPITEFTMPGNLKTIGRNAFGSTLLSRLVFNTVLEPMVSEDTVWSGPNTFRVTHHYNPCQGGPGVTFVVPQGCKNYRLENGALLSADGTVLYAQTSDLGGGTYTVPAGVKILGEYSMSNNGTFSDIVLPQGLTTMEGYCLYGTSIRSLSMPDSVTHVQESICENCTSLRSVRISNSLEELGESAGWQCFYGCLSLSDLTLGSNLRVIGNSCFAGTALTSVNLPSSLKQLNYGAFGDCKKLSSVTGGANLEYIYGLAFRNASLSGFPFGTKLRYLANNAFENAGFTVQYPSYLVDAGEAHIPADSSLVLTGTDCYGYAWQVLDLVNQQRAQAGLGSLTMDADLMSAAMQRAAEIAVDFDHTRPTGATCFTVSSKAIGENIAGYYANPSAVMDGWMNSPGHRANILGESYTTMGVGCFKIAGRCYWVQLFGRGSAASASKSGDVARSHTVFFDEDYLTSDGVGTRIQRVDDSGRAVSDTDDVAPGYKLRYVMQLVKQGYSAVPVDNSCVAWTSSGSGGTFSGGVLSVSGSGTMQFGASIHGTYLKAAYSRTLRVSSYKVTFNSNGGSAVASQTVQHGGKASRPANPTRKGYVFADWCLDKALTRAYDFSTPVSADTVLYAKWTPLTYTVSFNSNGGSAVKAQKVQYGGKAAQPANPTRSGYAFKGWYIDAGLNKKFDFSTAVRANITLYASWQSTTPAKPAEPSKPSEPSRPSQPSKPSAPTSYKDVPGGTWYHDWVIEASSRGLMNGLTDSWGNFTGYFQPERAITRAEVAAVLWRTAGSPYCTDAVLPDVKGHWSMVAVAWCMKQGIITGYTDGPNAGLFLPDQQVSREELATMVYRFARWAGVKTANPPAGVFNACGDTWAVSPWARDAMRWCAASGVITGVTGGAKPMLCPQDGAIRAQAAKIFVQTSKLVGGEMRPYDADDGDPVVTDASEGADSGAPAEVPQVTYGVTDAGLAYATVPEGALDERGEAYDEDAGYDELVGRYVGPGVYVTGYTGSSADLALPSQIGGVDVVSANLAWQGNAEANQPDPEGKTRLGSLTLERGCALVSLDVSGNALAKLAFTGKESVEALPQLRFLDLSGNFLTAFDPSVAPLLEELSLRECPLAADALETLSAWHGATGLAADLSDAGAKDRPGAAAQPGEEPDAQPAEPGQAAGSDEADGLAGSAGSSQAGAVEPETPDEPSQGATDAPSDAAQPSRDESGAASDASDASAGVTDPAQPEPDASAAVEVTTEPAQGDATDLGSEEGLASA